MLRKALLIVVAAVQLVVGLSLSSRAASSVLSISVSLAHLTISATEETVETASVPENVEVSGAQQCKEPGTCSDSENISIDTTPDDSKANENTEQSNDDKPAPIITATVAPNGDAIITHEELAKYTGKEEGSTIWLSILGKVFDVTTGPEFYSALKGGYKFYAGRDASPCFGSGTNNEEGANEKLEEWEDKKLVPVYEWATFYEDHETYVYKGVLAGSRYFDEEGNETPLRKEIVKRASERKRIDDEEREAKRKKRQAEREARKKKKEQEGKI